MDTNRFDDIARVLSAARSRRGALGGVLAGGLGALLSRMGWHEAAAKKKKKKKKKCKSTQQKCGKTCIPLTDCCGGCGGDQICSNGRCGCPGDTNTCGQECVTGPDCCSAADCGSGQSCVDGFCRCPDASDIPCGNSCCDGASQVCAVNRTTGASSCQADSCPAGSNFCADNVTFTCGPQCACVTSINTRTVCTNFAGTCAQCASDAQCTTDLGQDAVCVPVGSRCACDSVVTRTCRVVGCPSS